MDTIGKSTRRWLAALLAGSCGALALAGTAGAMDFPREGNPAIPNGVAAPFEGRWSVGYPEGEGMINGAPKVTCTAPVELQAAGEGRLRYLSPTGAAIEFELTEFSGRTTWLPEQGESLLAVWIDTDEFFAYSVDLATGKARWNDPSVYRRC